MRPLQTHPNASAATLAGSVTVLAVYVAGVFGLSIPVEVGSAFTTIIAAVTLALPGPKRRR